MMLVVLPLGVGLACGPAQTEEPAQTVESPETETIDSGPTTEPPATSTATPQPPTESTAPCDGCTATPTGSPFFTNGRYEREKAAKFAEDNKGGYQDSAIPYYEPTDCTNFVSYAMNAVGLLPTGEWKPGGFIWINTQALFDFLHTVGFQELATFDNVGDYRTEDDNQDFLHLRENTEDVGSFQGVVPKITWSQYMVEISAAQRGDLIFYSDRSQISTGSSGEIITWTHVAMITDWAAQTSYAWPTVGTHQEPRVIDHDGPPS
ncbi:MAG: hypothetical protein DWB48_08470, partial [Nitrosomonas sp.]|nr:hypothetical protein [Nitrosomonas sp.]